jgi:nucleoside-diphosphate-sugar epimerase
MGVNSGSRVLITGSSGYVASFMVPLLKQRFKVTATDRIHGKHTDIISDIAADNLCERLNPDEDYIVIHCAAARFDYGLSADTYFQENVSKTKAFLSSLASLKISQFIHVSSVAAIDGRALFYDDSLDCDNAYRVTKYLQQREVINWCEQNKVPWDVVMPSAIYDDEPRWDTNIGRLQMMTRFFPVLPKIEVKKSLTYLPKFCAFVEQRIGSPSGSCYLTIEKPTRTVTQIVRNLTSRKVYAVYVPGLKIGLFLFSWIFLGIASIRRTEPMLTPSRVTKLFNDTSYEEHDEEIDQKTYDRSIL